MKIDLLSKIEERSAKIGIIGLGYVGLPLALRFCQENFKVIGFDSDLKKVNMLKQGKSYIKYIPSSRIARFLSPNKSLFMTTGDTSKLSEVDVIIICVPTPLTDKREPDMQYVEKTAETVAKYLRPPQLISLESTTYPGTTEELILPILERRDLKVGKDFFLVFSPERADPGNEKYTSKAIPKIIGGISPECLKVGIALYSKIVERVVPVSSTKVAEATKLLENIYRAVNIAMVNELKMVFERMGIDIWEVIEAAKTKPFGFKVFYPGPGLGGHCIPIDPFYLTWKAREYDLTTRLIELAGEINTSIPYYVVEKVIDALNKRGKSVKGSRILILGVAYKKDIDDTRESSSLKLIKLLLDKGAIIDYNDPYIPSLPETRKYKFHMKSVELTEKSIKRYDCLLIATNHSVYDYKWILKNANLIVDTRNAIKESFSKVIKA